MSNGSLSEQMGAMALVDELRLQQRQVREHLDLPRRRAEVAERIRGYYQRQGIACDDTLIDQGVREFFAHRLVFEAPALPWPRRVLVGLFLRRRVMAWMLVWVALLGGALLAANLRQPAATSQPAPAVTEPAAPQQPLADQAAHQARLEHYRQLMARLGAMPLPDDVRAKLLPFARSTGPLVADHGPARATQALRELEVYIDFTESALTLVIPDRADQVSGYERCLKATACLPDSEDGKAWFLVFQAHDPQGKVVTMPLTDSITGKIALTDAIGVQVSHAQYLDTRKDKQAKGHIAPPLIGKKDAYSLNRRFDARILPGGRYDNPVDAYELITASF
ncbi:DUF6384 family protein [Pseudomonas sp. UFMG81]|uniref:DUF6384 family protein n=1 Tax=Pseudomonas sp. UFMG81 TaxID=2745936 RepID=UPI00188DFC97|nr:DUF6384 family protein [Pseudomonas sp. UFMG81]